MQGKSEAWNRGAYLATALGHCNECHTPRNNLYALKHDRELAGEVLQGWNAYNITSDKTYGVGGWTDQATGRLLGKGHANGRGAASAAFSEHHRSRNARSRRLPWSVVPDRNADAPRAELRDDRTGAGVDQPAASGQ